MSVLNSGVTLMDHGELCLHVQADDILQASTGFDFAPDESLHGYRIGVDHTTGVTVYVSTAPSAIKLTDFQLD